ncbi:MAG: succinylglutamate desuccinylase/aspartoacylase family protein, partial [Dehalococcoidia bacterium]
AGPTVVVLGGVHGNEPGGWLAAEAIAEWPVTSGTLVVVPRANRQAVEMLARTSAALGDLNRLYPGDPDGLPMSAMAYEITSLVRGHQPHFVFDLHESWGFYAERSADAGTAAVGQTVAVGGVGADMPLMEAVVREVNAHLAPREQLTLADRRGESTAWASAGNSSISLGQFVEGCSPVLVEMAQQDQPAARRAEMHVLLVRTALEHLGMA